MLARYLRRPGRPLRYAVDPAHARGVANFLALAGRGQDVPHLVRRIGLEQHDRSAGPLLQGVLHEGDPDALMMLHDLAQDATGFHPIGGTLNRSEHHPGQLLVEGLHRMLEGLRQHGHPAIQAAMGDPEAMGRFAGQEGNPPPYLPLFRGVWDTPGRGHRVPDELDYQGYNRGGYVHHPHLNVAMNAPGITLRDSAQGDASEIFRPYSAAYSRALDLLSGFSRSLGRHSIPLGLAGMYDAFHGALGEPRVQQSPAASAVLDANRRHSARLLRSVVLPMLLRGN